MKGKAKYINRGREHEVKEKGKDEVKEGEKGNVHGEIRRNR